MFSKVFSPVETYSRSTFLRVCTLIYIIQVCWASLVFAVLYTLSDANLDVFKLIVFGSFFLFLYLFLCAFAKRLKALSYNSLWLVPIGLVLCFVFALTAFASVIIVPINIHHFIDGNIMKMSFYVVLSNAVTFSASIVVALAVAYLPKLKTTTTLTGSFG